MIFFAWDLILFLIAIIAISLIIDLLIAELPVSIHPVVFIGNLTNVFTRSYIKLRNRFSGVLLTLTVVLIAVSLFYIILEVATINLLLFIILSSILLSTTFSFKMLLSSTLDIKKDLLNDINKARDSMSYLVSRDTSTLSEKLIISASIETLSENITDSIVSPIFYFLFSALIAILSLLFINSYSVETTLLYNFQLLETLPNLSTIINDFTSRILHLNLNTLLFNNMELQGFYTVTIFSVLIAIVYRIINTLDAMVGYKNEKFTYIGYFPANVDDILNFIPSRFASLMVILSAFLLNMNWKNSYKILKRDSRKCQSPNSGFTIATVAGAINIQLEKKNSYVIGDLNEDLAIDHIDKAIKLSKIAIILSILSLIIIFLLINIIFNMIILNLII